LKGRNTVTDQSNVKLRPLAELAGAVAVLLGLVFVGVELKQNTEAVQAATLQSMTDASQEYLLLLASDPDLNRIWRTANLDPDALTDAEASQYFVLVRAQWLRFQNSYLQWQRGTMSDEDWVLYENFVCDMTASTMAQSRRRTWSDHKKALTTRFVEFVENCWAAEMGQDRG
jgi:hypothetical protein